ncbi:MAG: DUF4163 domain-containing protein [Lachnospiraceae bacterium]|nr:DUF4163 domain-containing protein [Lachnospiraceae bacterium]MDD7668024.1 DUF4163 domain-containing protein [Lachnospiraceae bacterium]MDY2620410.1 DUF4163 domain-containing protein [Agathobacter sp.]
MKRKMSVLALCLAAVLTITGLSAGKVQASPKVYTGNNQNNISYLTIDYSESCKTGKIKGKYTYTMPALQGTSKVVKKINKALKAGYTESQKDKEKLWNYVKDNSKDDAMNRDVVYELTSTCKVRYNQKGYISFSYDHYWFAGGVSNIWTDGMTFDLKTGKKLSVSDVVSGSNTKIRKKILAKYEKKNGELGTLGQDEILKDTKMKDFQFYLNKDGNVVVCFGPYQPGGGNGESTITLKSSLK